MSAQEKNLRSCISCGAKSKKSELYRLVRTKQGEILVDEKGSMAGRGAYVCSKECIEAALKTKRLERALKSKIAPLDYERIINEFDAMVRKA